MMKFNEVIDMRYGERKGEVSKWANRRYAHANGTWGIQDCSGSSGRSLGRL
jgi:hypothetical protein